MNGILRFLFYLRSDNHHLYLFIHTAGGDSTAEATSCGSEVTVKLLQYVKIFLPHRAEQAEFQHCFEEITSLGICHGLSRCNPVKEIWLEKKGDGATPLCKSTTSATIQYNDVSASLLECLFEHKSKEFL